MAQSPSSGLQRAATQREQSDFLRASEQLQKSAFYFSALQKHFFLSGKEIFASHIARVKTHQVKISSNVCRNTAEKERYEKSQSKQVLLEKLRVKWRIYQQCSHSHTQS